MGAKGEGSGDKGGGKWGSGTPLSSPLTDWRIKLWKLTEPFDIV